MTSQFFANLYLDALDKYVKRSLGVKAYLRYGDDFVLFDDSARVLKAHREAIESYLSRVLRLSLNPRRGHIRRTSDGERFLGFRIFPDHRLLTRENVTRAHRRLRRLAEEYERGILSLGRVQASLRSWLAHAAHGDTWGLRRSVLRGLALRKGPSAADNLERDGV